MIGRRVFNDGNSGCDPRADEFKSMVVELMVLAGVFNVGDFVPALEWLDLQGVQAKMKKLHKRFDEFLTSIIQDHEVSKSEKHNDLLSKLLSLKEKVDEDEDKLNDTQIKALLLVCRQFIHLLFLIFLLLMNQFIWFYRTCSQQEQTRHQARQSGLLLN